jgi:hypothetical protein
MGGEVERLGALGLARLGLAWFGWTWTWTWAWVGLDMVGLVRSEVRQTGPR